MEKTDYVVKIYNGNREFKTIGVFEDSEETIKYIVENPLKGAKHYKVIRRDYYKGKVDNSFEIM